MAYSPVSPKKPSLTLSTGQDDLYDISEDERDDQISMNQNGAGIRSRTYSPLSQSVSHSWNSAMSRNKYPSIRIPPGTVRLVTQSSKSTPISVTNTPNIIVSPAILSLLAGEVPSTTSTPSLDGSLTSDQLVGLEAPPTPRTGADADENQPWERSPRTTWTESSADDSTPWERGIQLNPEALATLQFLSDGNPSPAAIESQVDVEEHHGAEMQQVVEAPPRPKSAEMLTPATPYSLSELNIPSPTAFFSSLGQGSRSTWCTERAPNSATAERFYMPQHYPQHGRIVTSVLNADEQDHDDPPTARRIPDSRAATPFEIAEIEPRTEPMIDFDNDYEHNLKEGASMNLDRTSMWLQQQETLLAGVKSPPQGPTSPESPRVEQLDLAKSAIRNSLQRRSLQASPAKKLVRFSAAITTQDPTGHWVEAERKEAVFLRAFQHVAETSAQLDCFNHSQQRYEALQFRRLCLQQAHRRRLEGAFQPLSKSLPEEPTEQAKAVVRAEKEQHALRQVDVPSWNIAATKMLNGGRLLSKPAAKRIAHFSSLGTSGNRARVLDLGGQPVCDWAWECAREYPNVKVYTVVTKDSRNAATSTIRGPSNHRIVSVPSLWRLPFGDSHFDVISARTVHMLLKNDIPQGQWDDEFDLCLKECMRCLKPGGYLDFSILDSDVVNAGPLAGAMSAEFSNDLKSRGYDPHPTRSWLSRLRKSGYDPIKRAWIFFPVGPSPPKARVLQQRAQWYDKPEGAQNDEAFATTRDAASLTGLVGGLAWERWQLKLQLEMGKNEEGLFERVRSALDEGSKANAGWRCLTGYARKPLH
jgi:SAM-dependent methyltransferase